MRAWVSTTAHLAGGAFLLQPSFSQAQHSHALWWVTQNLHVPALSYHAWCFISWWHLHWMGCRGDCFCACLSLYQRPDLSITLLTFQQEMFFYSIPISAYDCRNLVVRARFVSTQAGLLQKVARVSTNPSPHSAFGWRKVSKSQILSQTPSTAPVWLVRAVITAHSLATRGDRRSRGWLLQLSSVSPGLSSRFL